MISKGVLQKLYINKGKSQTEIAEKLHCSVHKVAYWMGRHRIKTRTISQAVYNKHNPFGDPFLFTPPQRVEAAILYGLGLGLFWGEGTKANRSSVRLGNTDPRLIKAFILFLVRLFGVKKSDIRFSLQVFSDLDEDEVTRYWVKALGVRRSQFTKSTVTPFRSLGTYRKKSEYGVITLYYHNTRLRNLIGRLLEEVDASSFAE